MQTPVYHGRSDPKHLNFLSIKYPQQKFIANSTATLGYIHKLGMLAILAKRACNQELGETSEICLLLPPVCTSVLKSQRTPCLKTLQEARLLTES